MGLDTVELVMRFEKCFGIVAPDKEWETAQTVQQAADVIIRHLPPLQPKSTLRQQVGNMILNELGISDVIDDRTGLPQLIDEDRTREWRQLIEERTGWKLPPLHPRDASTKKQGGWPFRSIDDNEREEVATFGELVDRVIAMNPERVIDPRTLAADDVLKVVIAITADHAGLEVHEVLPWHSFTTDLGLD